MNNDDMNNDESDSALSSEFDDNTTKKMRKSIKYRTTWMDVCKL